MPATIRKYLVESRVPRLVDGQPVDQVDTSLHFTREIAERRADQFYKNAMLAGANAADVKVHGITDDGAVLVYQLEPAPEGVLITRLRARLRHHRQVNRKQYAALVTIHRGAAQRATETEIRDAMGRYATNSFKSCVRRGWISAVPGETDMWELTTLGREVLADQDDPDAPPADHSGESQ